MYVLTLFPSTATLLVRLVFKYAIMLGIFTKHKFNLDHVGSFGVYLFIPIRNSSDFKSLAYLFLCIMNIDQGIN